MYVCVCVCMCVYLCVCVCAYVIYGDMEIVLELLYYRGKETRSAYGVRHAIKRNTMRYIQRATA